MKRVLIVDDTSFMRTSLRMILERNGFEIAGEAENGTIALHKYKELRPDIITMDITMPICDGIKATKMILEIDPRAIIIVISSMGQEAFVREAVIAGAKGFILKPFEEKYVIQTLSKEY